MNINNWLPSQKGKKNTEGRKQWVFRTCYFLKNMDNLDGYDSSDDFLLGLVEKNTAMALQIKMIGEW